MTKFAFSNMPLLRILTRDDILTIHNASLDLLEKVGVKIYSNKALQLLNESGSFIDFRKKLARIPQDLVEEALRKAPSSIRLYSRDKKNDVLLEGNDIHFYPGSSAIKIFDVETKKLREPTSRDAINLAILVDALEFLDTQFAAIVVSDVPEPIRDTYRYYLWLKNTTKHVMVSCFDLESPQDIRALAAVIAGGEEELSRKPYVSSIVCPSPPLMWSELACQNLMEYAKYSIPTVILPMPQINATGPATLAANVVQNIVEGLSGLVIAQLVKAGAPVIFGSDTSLLDPRTGVSTTTVESVMVCCAVAQVAKFYGLPTHTYVGESDSKILDVQTGLEATMSIILGSLAGINLMSGPGMMTFGLAQSFEKIVIDNEICGMAYRLIKGIDVNDTTIAKELFEKHGPGGHFLGEKHTLEWFRKEQFIPSSVIDRFDVNQWEAKGAKDIVQRASERVREILATHVPEPLPPDVEKQLDDVMKEIAKKHNIKKLPLEPRID